MTKRWQGWRQLAQWRDRGKRSSSPSASESCRSSTSLHPLVKQFHAEREAMEHGSAGMRIHHSERQQPGWLTGLELCPKRWQHGRAFDGGDDDGGAPGCGGSLC
jgi:hypothetical protein